MNELPSPIVGLAQLEQNTSRIAFLDQVESLLKKGVSLGVAADFDHNISRGGPSHGLDPRDSYIDPTARQALASLGTLGIDVVILSSRGAQDIAEIVQIPGISIIGTLGWETLDTQGVSHIHPQFEPFQTQITGILREIRERFLTQQLKLSGDLGDRPSYGLSTLEGDTIILQRKGCGSNYPEGINSTWTLNLVAPDKRINHQQALHQFYLEAFDKNTANLTLENLNRLRQLCGFMIREGKTTEGLPTLDVEIRPITQSAKVKAMLQLMREPANPKRQIHFRHMPYNQFWIYSGDHTQQDTPVMRAGHSFDVLSKGKGGVLGVWAKPIHEEYKTIRGVDLVVDSVSGNTELLKEIAQRAKNIPPKTDPSSKLQP